MILGDAIYTIYMHNLFYKNSTELFRHFLALGQFSFQSTSNFRKYLPKLFPRPSWIKNIFVTYFWISCDIKILLFKSTEILSFFSVVYLWAWNNFYMVQLVVFLCFVNNTVSVSTTQDSDYNLWIVGQYIEELLCL